MKSKFIREVSYEGRLREMDADELEAEAYNLTGEIASRKDGAKQQYAWLEKVKALYWQLTGGSLPRECFA